MKKTILLLLLSLTIALQSCVDNSATFPEEADGIYYGNLTVGDYTERVGISVLENENSRVDVFFNDIKFAKGMPVRIDMTVKGIASQTNDGVLSFSAKNIDPYMNKEEKPQSKYRLAEISGMVVEKELLLSAMMSDTLKGSFAGKRFSFRGTCK